MKPIPYLAAGVIAVIVTSALLPPDSSGQANRTIADTPDRLIDLLSKDSIVELHASSAGAYQLVLLSDKLVDAFRASVKRLEERLETARNKATNSEANADDLKGEIARIESGWYKLETPWKVVQVGDDFVRLEPLIQLPRHEEVTWIAIPESTIQFVKSKQ